MDRGDRAMALKGDPHVLIVAGSDSSGGAGIARDIEAVSAVGLRTCLAVTAVTVQMHHSVDHIEYIAPDLVAAQMRAALVSNTIAAIKVGMLGMMGTVEAVASVLLEHPSVPVVLDPVLASSSGRLLLAQEAIDTMKTDLMPLCRLVTPNLPELAILAGTLRAGDESEAFDQGRSLLNSGLRAVLIKGGHSAGPNSTDILLCPGKNPIRFDAPRLAGEMRGTGCMLASAIAAHLARGKALEDCVRSAKRYVFDRYRQLA
ncbi:hydroxymethylpyrimidine/phosphomethylpyrimidine kinase [Mesorhizobium sp. CCNWLW179-1]|uniref:hydroxymethylpyrimidine/phosphomethylpyrimidine kinase n=2 Tax=Mesorhizobium TaxID=68287 RepID=UPI00301571BE